MESNSTKKHSWVLPADSENTRKSHDFLKNNKYYCDN